MPPLAAAPNIVPKLPPNIVYAGLRNGLVEFAGKTANTAASRPINGEPLAIDAYDYCENHFSVLSGQGRVFHWWKLPTQIEVICIDTREWRSLLEQILADIGVAPEEASKKKASINGIVAAANGTLRRIGPYTVQGMVSVCVQRMKGRAELKEFTNHPLFDTFLLKRAKAFIA